MNKLIIVALLAIIAVSAAIMPLNGRYRGTLRFPGWKNRQVVAEDEEEADAEFLGKFLKKVGKVALDAGKMYVGQKYGINLDAEEDEEEADAEFLGKALKKVGKVALSVGKMYARTQGIPIDAEEESDAEFLGKALKKVGKVALQVGKAYVGQKYGINLDEEEEADSEFLGKVLKKVGKVALNVGKMYARTQGIPIDAEEEADFINWKKVWGTAKDIGKNYLSTKYGINLDEAEEEEESDSEASPLSVAQLQQIMPTLSSSKANEYIGYLNAAMNEFSINSCPRRSAFLAQLAHESGQLRWFEEFASGAAYEGRKDLGNTQPGDGKRYKGRGPIQLTGRANYRSAGSALGLNLEANPTQASTPQVGFRIAGWFWSTRSLNSLADQNTQGAFDQITRRINGGTNGKADRDHFWKIAKRVLGC